MKKLLLCLAFLGISTLSYSKDIYITYPNYLYSTNNSVSAGFTLDPSGILVNLKCNKQGLLIGVSSRAVLTAFVTFGGLYLAYKVYCLKKRKHEQEA